MKIKDFKCSCGYDEFYAFTPKEANYTGIYCSYCGKWLKWANKEEKRLISRNEAWTNLKGVQNEQRSV